MSEPGPRTPIGRMNPEERDRIFDVSRQSVIEGIEEQQEYLSGLTETYAEQVDARYSRIGKVLRFRSFLREKRLLRQLSGHLEVVKYYLHEAEHPPIEQPGLVSPPLTESAPELAAEDPLPRSSG